MNNNDNAPPQAIEAEESVIGTCLVYPDAINEVRLKPEMFYKDAHRKIFEAIMDMAMKGQCDLITVTDNLRKKNQLEQTGGPVYLTGLTRNIISDQMIGSHSLIINEKYLLREYIRVGQAISNMGFIEDLLDVTEYAENSLFMLSNFTQVKEPRPLVKCVDDLLAEVESIHKKEKSLGGVPSGFNKIDRLTGGWQPGNLIIVAGRPSMGKTSLALSLAANPSRLGYPVGFFSLEMSTIELASRYLSGSSGYSNVEIRNANLDFEKLVNSSHEIANLPIFIDDTPALSLFELRSKVKKLILRSGVKMVVVDYLQLMVAKDQDKRSREQEVSTISRGLKAIAKEFNIPVIALSQLNRSVETRGGDGMPKLSDLRESGAIEQDADIVCFVSRPAILGIEYVKVDGSNLSTTNMLLVDCAKDRNGAIFSAALYHNSSMTVIRDHI